MTKNLSSVAAGFFALGAATLFACPASALRLPMPSSGTAMLQSAGWAARAQGRSHTYDGPYSYGYGYGYGYDGGYPEWRGRSAYRPAYGYEREIDPAYGYGYDDDVY